MPYPVRVLPFSIQKGHPYKTDENGVILSKIPYTPNFSHHTTAVASYCIQNMYDVDDDSEYMAQKQLQWLLENMSDDGAYWHDFSFPFYDDFPQPWVGGLAQGLAISAFVRAYILYKDKKYLECAKRAYNALNKYCLFTNNDGVWIKEYPNVPTILNGMIYAMFGVYDMMSYDDSAVHLWESTVDTLLRNLCRYDTGYWSKYDLVNHYPATPFYHGLHIRQLKALYTLTGEKVFLWTSENWEKYLQTGHRRARLTRGIMLAQKHGVIGSYKRMKEIKRWKGK